MTDRLNEDLSHIKFARPLDAGIGIHVTAYEYVGAHWIPELFVLSNFSDPSYSRLHPNGVLLNRQTYNRISDTEPEAEHRDAECRLRVHEYLQHGAMLIYNNGDPLLFNPAARAILEQMSIVKKRGKLANPRDIATYRNMARISVRIVAEIQRNLYRPETQSVGGKIHTLAVTPSGQYPR